MCRGAWERQDALGLLPAGAGTLFDARCVAELELLTESTTRQDHGRPHERRAA